jgi:PHP family Zn ribbon phosphoesterase
MRAFRADLHLHTCLSPCAELDNSPRRLAAAARAAGLDLIAVTDHNAALNVPAVRRACAGGPAVLGGMEVTSREEVHLIVLFPGDGPLFAFQEAVHARLPDTADEQTAREQVVADEADGVNGFCHKLLWGAVDLSLEELAARAHALGGLAAAAHADREGFGILGQLGFIPPGLPLDALEVRDPAVRRIEGTALPLYTASDAHRPGEVGTRVTVFTLESPTLEEIRLAFRGVGGRGLEY